MSKKLLLIGGGGHCRSVLDSVLQLHIYDQIELIDHKKDIEVCGIKVIGDDDDMSRLFEEGWRDAFVTVGSVGNTETRSRLFEMIMKIGFYIPNIFDPTAIFSKGIGIGDGIYIGKGAIINTGSKLGNNVIINTGVIVEHDCAIGDFAHVATGAILCGNVNIGAHSHIGAGSVIKQQVTIGQRALIGAGSNVLSDIPDGKKAYGNPCRIIES